MQNKQLKTLNVLFLISLLLVLVFSYFLLKSYNHTVALEKELVTQQNIIDTTEANLKKQKRFIDTLEANAIEAEKSFNEELNKLVNTIDSLKTSPRKLEEAIEDKYNQNFENRKYQIGVTTFKVGTKKRKQVKERMESNGLLVQNISPVDFYSQTPDWVANTSTVFWYDERNIILAQKLAKEIGVLMNEKIEVRKGAGFGVTPADKAKTFKIHLIGK